MVRYSILLLSVHIYSIVRDTHTQTHAVKHSYYSNMKSKGVYILYIIYQIT